MLPPQQGNPASTPRPPPASYAATPDQNYGGSGLRGRGSVPGTTPYASNMSAHNGAMTPADLANMEGGASYASEPYADESKGKVTRAYARKEIKPLPYAAAILGAFFVLSLIFSSAVHVVLVLSVCAAGCLFAYWVCMFILAKDDGTKEMRAISDPIRAGAEGFLQVQYMAIFKLAIVVAAVIFFSYSLRPHNPNANGIEKLGGFTLGSLAAVTFFLGAGCSGACGYVTMVVSAQANIRVASAARRTYEEALVLCFRGGAFSAILAIAMCIGGITILYIMVYMFYGSTLSNADMPMLLTGYGFGASFVAMFMQLGGGIYTKAADVGADLVGKVERDMPEDDPRNPAVIADLVGDMVGDCVGSSADVFESVSAEIIGAMILGGVLSHECDIENASRFIFFPVVVHAFNIIVSAVGILSVTEKSVRSSGKDPMAPLYRGFVISNLLAIVFFAIATRWLLETERAPGAWFTFFCCGLVGMITSIIFAYSSKYYTDYEHWPVQAIAKASVSGHGVNIITGVSWGLKSTVVPVLTVSAAVVISYSLGKSTGLGDGRNSGIFGTAVATMGMLSTAGYVLSMNNYGPIADNAGGIAEMSQQAESVRDTTDRLDAAGNVTKAMTKGYSIGSAALACFLLFGAFMDEFSQISGKDFHSVDIAKPEVLVGGLLGVMMIFYFAGLSIAAVGTTAEKVVEEVRRQLREHPGIMDFKETPDYHRCVSIVTDAALKEMRWPGFIAVFMPITTGLLFRFIGDNTGRPLLGAEVLAGYLMFATVSGILMALFLDNVGGAWDNAKKYVELGNFGGKGSDAHKAAVTGDTVGDPFKDTAGPSLHVVIKLLSTTVLVLAPLFVSSSAAGSA
jgi:H+-translocating diphosphatase